MRLLLTVLLLPAVASASGFYLSENGAKALMMGGAFAGQADDLSAIQHNPAGLAQLTGFNFALDAQLVFHNITFQRLDPGFDAANPPSTNVQPVSNSGGPFVVPLIGAGFGLKLLDRTLFIGLGIYGPPADGHYAFPKPNYETDSTGRLVENARRSAAQRYSLVDNTIFVIFPTLSLAYEVHRMFMLGVSLQPVMAEFHFSQAVTSIDRFGIHPTSQNQEDPAYDSLVKVNLPMQYAQFTAVFGAMVKPTDWLQIGVSFRPQVMINARGTLEIEPGPIAKSASTIAGNQATLSLMLPAELKIGVHVKPIPKLGINCDFVYQGWQSVQEIVLDPQDVTLSVMGGPPTPVAPFRIQKRWKAAYNFRLGAAYALFPWLSLYLGGWYETGAIPREYIGVDFLHFERFNLTGGVGVKFAGFEILLGAAGSPAMTYAVTQSEVRAGSTEPDPAPIVGTGIYSSGNVMVSLGIRGRFGGGDAPRPAEPAPAPAPAPATAPASEPAPATSPQPAPAPAPAEAPKS